MLVTPQDKIQVSCTYNPGLRQEIPYTRDLPPQYITWGDGSADEMCLAIVMIVPDTTRELRPQSPSQQPRIRSATVKGDVRRACRRSAELRGQSGDRYVEDLPVLSDHD